MSLHSTSRSTPPNTAVMVAITTTISGECWLSCATSAPPMPKKARPRASATCSTCMGRRKRRTTGTVSRAATAITSR